MPPQPSLFLYILTHDSGFAPNPFHGCCTLACCKPRIRALARPGDWLVGITPKGLGNRLAYAMEIAEVLTFAEYFADRRFALKKPIWKHGAPLTRRRGDNIYRPLPGGGFEQLPSNHYDHARGREDVNAKRTDLGGKHVLVSRRFAYFGSSSKPLPTAFASVMPARARRRVRPASPV